MITSERKDKGFFENHASESPPYIGHARQEKDFKRQLFCVLITTNYPKLLIDRSVK